jgi:hypothetical protein
MRSKKHLDFIRSLPCLVCGDDQGSDACHVRYSEYPKVNPGIGAKPGDEFTVPMCRRHHSYQHRGSETQFWASLGIDPLKIAEELFHVTGDHAAACSFIKRHQTP